MASAGGQAGAKPKPDPKPDPKPEEPDNPQWPSGDETRFELLRDSLGAASLAITAFNARLEARIAHVEMRAAEHDQRIEYLRTRTEEQERQLARFEAALNDIAEIKADVKALLRNGKGKLGRSVGQS